MDRACAIHNPREFMDRSLLYNILWNYTVDQTLSNQLSCAALIAMRISDFSHSLARILL